MRKSIENQLDTLDSELKLLLRDLKAHSDQDLNWKPKTDKWSVAQVMQHLMKSEELALKYVQKKLSFEPELKNAGVMAALRGKIIKMYLKSPFKVKAPSGVSDDNFPEEASFWDLVKQWQSQRAEMRTYLGTLPDDLFKKAIFKHPLGGRISLGAMLEFHIGHFRRHRGQIDKVLKNFKY